MASGYLVQGPSSPTISHYALVRSLADGTAVVDRTMRETGPGDFAYFHGHYYSNKAPGLAFVALPVYAAVAVAGLDPDGDPDPVLWTLGLVGAVLPATVLLFLVRGVVDRLAPGFGTAAAVTLGLGSLLTVFEAAFFPHALSACLLFGAFALLFHDRRSAADSSLLGTAAAGLAAGYAVTTEYDGVIAAAILALYAAWRPGVLRHVLAYGSGAIAGVLPLVAYNLWAFGSATHLSYTGTILEAGGNGHAVLFQVDQALGRPSVATAVDLLFSRWGLVTLAPVLLTSVAGAVLLYRAGRRADVLTIAAIVLAYLAYDAAYYEPFGQIPPGPRFLVASLPFLAVLVGVSFRRFPWPTAILAAVSAAVSVSLTATRPYLAWDGGVFFRLVHPSWWSPMVPDLFGIAAWYRVLPYVAALAVAAGCAVLATPALRAGPAARGAKWRPRTRAASRP